MRFVGTFLQARVERETKLLDIIMISSQLLFLLYIYLEGNQLYLAEATKKLPYSAMIELF